MLFLLYVMLIRPQRKYERDRQRMIAELKKGDKVMTSSGIFGTVVEMDEQKIVLDVGKNLRIPFSRNAVSSLMERKGEGKEEPKK